MAMNCGDITFTCVEQIADIEVTPGYWDAVHKQEPTTIPGNLMRMRGEFTVMKECPHFIAKEIPFRKGAVMNKSFESFAADKKKAVSEGKELPMSGTYNWELKMGFRREVMGAYTYVYEYFLRADVECKEVE